MNDRKFWRGLAGLLFPPLWLPGIWTSGRRSWAKILLSLGAALLLLVESALLVFLLVQFGGLRIEWRGGYLPALTWKKTAPNYDLLEQERAKLSIRPGPKPEPKQAGAYWTGFRGPRGDGVYDEVPIRTNWPAAGLQSRWKQPIGGGYSSFAIAQGLAFTLEQRRDQEVAVAYDTETGQERWTQSWQAQFKEYYSEEGPRTTPAYGSGRVYTLGALGELRCMDASSGSVIWSRNVLTENQARPPGYGLSASPLLADGQLIVFCGAGKGKSILSFEPADGKLRWGALDDGISYTTPMLVELAGQRQLLVVANKRVLGVAPDGRNVLWEYPWRVEHGPSPIAQPVLLSSNRFLVSAGYFTGCAAVEIERRGSDFTARTLWQNKNLKNKFTSSVFLDGFVYGLDEDILTCLDAATGARKWKEGRYGYGQLILASGCLVILAGNGDLALVPATAEPQKPLGRFPAIRGKTWNHLAIGGGKLLIRNESEMACFDLSLPGR